MLVNLLPNLLLCSRIVLYKGRQAKNSSNWGKVMGLDSSNSSSISSITSKGKL